MKQGNGPTSQDEEEKPGLFLSCGRTFGVPLEWRRVCWATSCVASRVSRTLSRLKREGGISLETPQGKEASSRIEGRISWFYSSWDKEIGVPFELQQGPLGTHSCCLRKASLHVNCEGPHTVLSGINVQLRHGPSAEATALALQPSKLDEPPRRALGGHGRAGLARPFPGGRCCPRGGPCPPRHTQPPRRALGCFRHPRHKGAFPRSRCQPRGGPYLPKHTQPPRRALGSHGCPRHEGAFP